MKINVLYLLDYTDLGGGETSFLSLMDALSSVPAAVSAQQPAIHPVVVLPEKGRLWDELARRKLTLYHVPYPRRFRRGPFPWLGFKAVTAIGRIIQDEQVVLVHAWNVFGLLYGGMAARRQGVPAAWTCHGWYDVDNVPKRLAARHLAQRIACVSESVREEAVRRLGQAEKITTNHLGLIPFTGGDTQTLRAAIRREFGIPEPVKLLAVVGRFQPIKGHRFLLDALPAIRQQFPSLQVWFIGDALFGKGEQDHKKLLLRRVEDEGLSGCVTFLGFRRDARRLLRALDVLVIPSERESFSMVAAEGLEAGVPVVGPNGWGPREIIQVPQTGFDESDFGCW